MQGLLLQLGLIFVVATVLGYMSKLFKQPPVLGYILAGVVLGFLFLDHSTGITLELFSQLGVALLLFMLGLELNIVELKEVGPVSLAVGVGQVVVTSIIGFVFAQALFGFPLIEAIYIAVALTFSSTIIIIKLLGEKGDLNSLYGRISVGMLIVQDVIAIIVLIALNSLGGAETGGSMRDLVLSVGEIVLVGVLLFGLAMICGRLLDLALKAVGRSTEIILLSGVAWALLFSSLTQYLGFSIEVGAFLAGIALATSSVSVEMAAKIKPLRDFFIILFFIVLGMSLNFNGFAGVVWPVLMLSLLVVVGNPLILLVIMGLMGYHRRVSFLTGLTVSQISEFSLILVGTGVALGQGQNSTLVIVTGVAVVTLVVSSYLISHGDRIYQRISPILLAFQRKQLRHTGPQFVPSNEWVLLVGAHRMGQVVLNSCREKGLSVVVVDYDPVIVGNLKEQGIEAIYGDLGDPELIGQIDLGNAVAVVSTVPDLEDNLLLLTAIKRVPGEFLTIVRAQDKSQAEELCEHGADYALIPEYEAGERVVALLSEHGVLASLSR